MDKKETPRIALHSIGSLFSETWKLYKERWSVLVEIVLLPTLVVALGVILVGLNLGSAFRALGLLVVFVGWVIFIYSVLPVIYSIHNTTGVDASYKATIGSFWPYIWVGILEFLSVLGGAAMLIIPGIWLGIALSFAVYIFIIEHRRGIDALRQSKDYVKGYWWAVLGRTLLLALIYVVVMVIVRIPVTLMGGQIAGGILSAVMLLFFIPFSAIYHYIIFNNLRELKPELAEMKTKEGTGFIKASAIVGVIVPILLVILAVILIAFGAAYMVRNSGRYVPAPGYPMRAAPQQ